MPSQQRAMHVVMVQKWPLSRPHFFSAAFGGTTHYTGVSRDCPRDRHYDEHYEKEKEQEGLQERGGKLEQWYRVKHRTGGAVSTERLARSLFQNTVDDQKSNRDHPSPARIVAIVPRCLVGSWCTNSGAHYQSPTSAHGEGLKL